MGALAAGDRIRPGAIAQESGTGPSRVHGAFEVSLGYHRSNSIKCKAFCPQLKDHEIFGNGPKMQMKE